VRELKNVVERVALFADGSRIEPHEVRPHLPGSEEKAWEGDFKDARARFERKYLEGALELSGGNVSEAARRAGLERAYFHRLLKKHSIDADAYR
jgi:two-component system response regulator GlrR